MIRVCVALSVLLLALGLSSCADEGESQTDSSSFDRHMHPIWSVGVPRHASEVGVVINKLARRLETEALSHELSSQTHLLRVAGLYSGVQHDLHSSVLKVRLSGINLEAHMDTSVCADFELPLSAEVALINLKSSHLVEIVCAGPVSHGLTPAVANCSKMLAYKTSDGATGATSNVMAYIRLMIERERSADSGL